MIQDKEETPMSKTVNDLPEEVRHALRMIEGPLREQVRAEIERLCLLTLESAGKDAAWKAQKFTKIGAVDLSGALKVSKDLERDLAAKESELREARLCQFSPMGDNHHNAWLCPYCNPQREAAEQRERELRADVEADMAELRYWRNCNAKTIRFKDAVDGLSHADRIAEYRIRDATLKAKAKAKE